MIDEVVKVFEEFIQNFHKTYVIVLRKEYGNSTFKAYKKLTYSLWLIDRETDVRHQLVTMDNTARLTTVEEEMKLRKALDNNLIMWMFEYIRKGDFNYVNE